MKCRILVKDIGRKLWNRHPSSGLLITVSRGLLTSGLLPNVTTQGVRQMAQRVQAALEDQPVDNCLESSRFSYKFDVDESCTPRFFSPLTVVVRMNASAIKVQQPYCILYTTLILSFTLFVFCVIYRGF